MITFYKCKNKISLSLAALYLSTFSTKINRISTDDNHYFVKYLNCKVLKNYDPNFHKLIINCTDVSIKEILNSLHIKVWYSTILIYKIKRLFK